MVAMRKAHPLRNAVRRSPSAPRHCRAQRHRPYKINGFVSPNRRFGIRASVHIYVKHFNLYPIPLNTRSVNPMSEQRVYTKDGASVSVTSNSERVALEVNGTMPSKGQENPNSGQESLFFHLNPLEV